MHKHSHPWLSCHDLPLAAIAAPDDLASSQTVTSPETLGMRLLDRDAAVSGRQLQGFSRVRPNPCQSSMYTIWQCV
jgi:hypothetical protein